MSSSWWTLIRSRLPDPVGGFIFDQRGTPESPLSPQFAASIGSFRCVRMVYNFFKIKEKRLWNSLTLLSKSSRPSLLPSVPVSACGVLSICWRAMVTTTPAPMLMCDKVTNNNFDGQFHYSVQKK